MKMSSITRRAVAAAALGVALLPTPASAHGVSAAATGLAFPVVVAGVVLVSLLGGGVVLSAYGRLSWSPGRAALPVLVVALGVAALALAVTQAAAATLVGLAAGVSVVYVARDAAVTDCGTCADAALGAVTLHRGLEGVVLATIYAADAALGLVGALVVAGHAAAETAAVGSLYAPAGRRDALAAVLVVQTGFVGGVAAGWGIVGGVSPTAEAGLLALVGGVLLAVGTRETRRRHVVGAVPA
jgi:zinc transporter ZupT